MVSLYAESGGLIKKIYHDINDTVKKGALILELESAVEEAQLKQAQSKLATQKAIIENASSQLLSLKTKLANASLNYERNQKLLQSGGVTKKETDDSKFNYESLQADLLAAEANVKQQQSKLSEINADIQYFSELLENKKVRAPMDGRILSMDVKQGNNISTTSIIGDFAPAGPLMAITEIDELYADQVDMGMKAFIKPQGKTDTIGTGSVFLTSPYLRKKSLFADDPANMEDRRVREVRVLLDKGSKALIGSRVECVIQIK
ncbi:MAG: efflux RND transporter periplasmic adaptor subunit [Chitinophagales bacterium]|nr:efflux RND transporter periplasmic adaptor subunit [Chitinophagales bacterium]